MEKQILSKKKVGKANQTTIQLSNKNKTFITLKQLKAISTKFESSGSKVTIRGLNIERWMTLKGMHNDFDDELFLEYYKNKVSDEDIHKFTTFAQVQISVFN